MGEALQHHKCRGAFFFCMRAEKTPPVPGVRRQKRLNVPGCSFLPRSCRRRKRGSVEISWGLFFILVKYCLLRIMKNDYLNMLASLVLPAQILDYFLISGVEQTSQEIHISLDEKMNSKLSNDEHFKSKGFMEAVNVTDFPIRDHKVILKIRRRRWTDLRTGKSFSIPIDLDVVAKGTRYSKEFGAFLKETYGDIPSDLPYA